MISLGKKYIAFVEDHFFCLKNKIQIKVNLPWISYHSISNNTRNDYLDTVIFKKINACTDLEFDCQQPNWS